MIAPTFFLERALDAVPSERIGYNRNDNGERETLDSEWFEGHEISQWLSERGVSLEEITGEGDREAGLEVFALQWDHHQISAENFAFEIKMRWGLKP